MLVSIKDLHHVIIGFKVYENILPCDIESFGMVLPSIYFGLVGSNCVPFKSIMTTLIRRKLKFSEHGKSNFYSVCKYQIAYCDYRDSLVSFEIISPRGARTLKIGSKAQYSLPKRIPMTCKILSETITHIKKCLFACIRTCTGPICGP